MKPCSGEQGQGYLSLCSLFMVVLHKHTHAVSTYISTKRD